jgi:hypothetical protein
LNIFCDSAHATCLATWQFATGILIFLNGALIHWYTKWQKTIESSTFGSEFIAIKIALKMNATLQYKFHMMGAHFEVASIHNSITYVKCHEECACEAECGAHKSGKENCSDGLTKCLAGPAFHAFTKSALY